MNRIQIFIFMLAFNCYSQDTVTIVRHNRKVSYAPFLKSFSISNDTIFETRSRYSNAKDGDVFDNWIDNAALFVFVDKKGRKIMETGALGHESIYGAFTVYYRNGRVKFKGYHVNGRCGEWIYYKRNGDVKRIEVLDECTRST